MDQILGKFMGSIHGGGHRHACVAGAEQCLLACTIRRKPRSDAGRHRRGLPLTVPHAVSPHDGFDESCV